MSVEQLVSNQLDYSQKVYNHPSPLYVKIAPQSGSSTITLTPTSVYGPVSFNIPAKVVNLARSYITFDLTLTGQAAKICMLQGNLCSFLNRAVLSTVGSNVILADVSNVGNYCEAVAPIATSQSEFLSKGSALATLYERGAGTAAALITNATRVPLEDIGVSYDAATNNTGSLWTTGGAVVDSQPAPLVQNIITPRYLYNPTTTANGTAANNTQYVSVRLPLSAFKYTAMAIDKDMYFAGESLNLDLYFEAGNKWGFFTDSAAVTGTITTLDTNVLAANNVSNLNFYACCEQNVAITSSIIEKVNSTGITMPIPVVYNSKQNIAAGAQSINLNINKAYGNKLLAILWAPYNTAESNETAKAHTIYPITGTSYQTLLNQVPILTNNKIDVSKGEHWLYNKEYLKDSAITCLPAFNQQFVHIDNFTGMSMSELAKNTTVYNGVDLASENQQWQLSIDSSTAQLNHYIFWITQKQLTIAPGLVTLL